MKITRDVLIPPQESVKIMLPHGGHLIVINASFLPATVVPRQNEPTRLMRRIERSRDGKKT